MFYLYLFKNLKIKFMKSIAFTLIIALFAYCIPAKAQWTDIQFQPLSVDFRDVFFFNPDTGWVVGSGIYRTNDSGMSWEKQLSYVGAMFQTVFFIDKNTGWAAGQNNILFKTNDGGQTWNQLSTSDSCWYYDIYFINQETGWVVGRSEISAFEVIYSTSDGGNSWFLQHSDSLGGCTSISFINDSVGWILGNYMHHTTNGGVTWLQQSASSGWKCNFVDSLYGWFVGQTFIYGTQDGGQTWTEKYQDPLYRDMYSVYFLNRDTGWAVGYDNGDGVIISTEDGGDTWTEQANNLPFYLFDIQFLNKDVGYTAGGSHVYRTENGGCCGISSVIQATLVVDIPANNNMQNVIRLMPNPFNSELFVEFDMQTMTNIKIDLYDINNRFIANLTNNSYLKGRNRLNLNMSNFQNGMYFLRVTDASINNCLINNFKIIKL